MATSLRALALSNRPSGPAMVLGMPAITIKTTFGTEIDFDMTKQFCRAAAFVAVSKFLKEAA